MMPIYTILIIKAHRFAESFAASESKVICELNV